MKGRVGRVGRVGMRLVVSDMKHEPMLGDEFFEDFSSLCLCVSVASS